ncbi:hypothetical protein [Streptomyces aidingensis]|uniref:Uncharacterized protein n=1 Tax=Streptomyces aidingensis TaxID=910347 RepID=A0A1I1PSJ0_9ACTN|nr:hypothetical protein [Streptomyces aidingensis]SFD12871.1 hypothetical protein SAMN05421773_11030 [Streptomyces aidingensis]
MQWPWVRRSRLAEAWEEASRGWAAARDARAEAAAAGDAPTVVHRQQESAASVAVDEARRPDAAERRVRELESELAVRDRRIETLEKQLADAVGRDDAALDAAGAAWLGHAATEYGWQAKSDEAAKRGAS